MNREAMMEEVRSQMPAKRWEHTVGVMKSAVLLAGQYGADVQKAELAALLHDYCKYWPVDKQRSVLEECGELGDLLEYDKALLHAPAAAVLVCNKFGIEDAEVLDAIRYHTSGRVGMTLLDKIVCLADYIEPGRDFPEVNLLRQLAETSLEKALIAGFDSTISYLLGKGQKVYPMTLLARNALIDECRGK
ncbi:bis(5'-nucleosyl)-tetraphosphatase (symmetrical) YqeK [Paenibacillus sp. MBLB4367]|uniref:bis(5'-nucleosyl)-tetraphosphatase (symmetrical) YqeK n=1 Tax=Paenibacillus sp. MBLB4367 TaxID=3384767 RepID=UPI003907FD90